MVRRMESHLKNSPKADVDDMKFTNYYENGKLVESDNQAAAEYSQTIYEKIITRELTFNTLNNYMDPKINSKYGQFLQKTDSESIT